MSEKKDENEPMIKKKHKKILKIILHAIGLIIIVMIFLTFNASISFLIKEATQVVLDEVLPSDCNRPPYGTEKVSACKEESLLSKIPKKIVRDVCDVAGFVTDAGSMKKDNKDNVKEAVEDCDNKRSIPYKWYTNNPDSVLREYLNWILNSLIKTQTTLHGHVKDFLIWIKSKPISMEAVLIVFSFIVAIIMIIPWIGWYILFSLLYHQVTSASSYGIMTMVLIFFTIIPVIATDVAISGFEMIKLLYDLSLKPLFNKVWRAYIKNILARNKIIVGYIFGFTFIQILNNIEMNKHYDKPVKLVPTIIFYLILVIHFLRWLNKILFKGGGEYKESKCKK